MTGFSHARCAAALAATTLFGLACSAPERPTEPVSVASPGAAGVTTQIADATNGSEPHFYWLPPIAPDATYPGTFDADVAPSSASAV